MPRQFVDQLRDGHDLDEVYLVTDKQLRANRNGNPYLLLELRDRTGGIQGRMWNAGENVARGFNAGDFVHASGKVQLFQGALQVILTEVHKEESQKIDYGDFLPQTEQSIPKLVERLRNYLTRLGNLHLRALAECFLSDDAFMRAFTTCPAGVKLHHAYVGGLLEHVVSMMDAADRLLPLYPGVDRDLLLMGVFLHDAGKTRELTYSRAFGYSDEGQLVGHIPIAVAMVAENAAKVPDLTGEPFPRELMLRIQHMILSHHGELEYGSPKVPMTPEATLLHLIDSMDTRMHMVLRELRDDRNNPSAWTPYNANLGRRIYKGGAPGDLYGESGGGFANNTSMPDILTKILHAVSARSYVPIKAKPLFKRLNLPEGDYPEFRRTVRELVRDGRLVMARNNTLRAADAHATLTGTFRRAASGHGFVRPHAVDGTFKPDVFIREGKSLDAATGDEVMVRVTREATHIRDAAGEVIRVLERATRTFVGTYFERDREALVRVDGNVFAHSVSVGDAGAKGVKPQDKVVIEMLRFPTQDERGEGVITEVLGPHGKPGVDTLSVIRAFGLPDAFPESALAEAREVASHFSEADLHGRTDFTDELVVTIDPPDAKDFDDAVSVTIDPKTKHWVLTVHIADVGAFAKAGGALDAEARRRATSVYLPQKVIPMFPEVISNGLASLQEGKVRYVKTVRMEFTPGLQKGHVEFFNGAIKNKKRFTYDEVQAVLDALSGGRKPPVSDQPPASEEEAQGAYAPRSEIIAMLKRMRDLALLLRKRRFKRGALELTMPEAVLEYDAEGRVSGAHFAEHNLSHQIIEEFMLAANEAVAEHFTKYEVPFLRRVHPAPNEEKLEAFAQFADLLGHPIKRPQDRFELQRVLAATADKPERAAVHFALLRSLKQAAYSPVQDEHYALAMQHYCHFTSPIRRYPDLQVHRLLDRWIRAGTAGANTEELVALGDHCSKMERRADAAERELVKIKLLTYLSTRLGEQLDAVVTGVADYGFFAQAERFPAEGLVHISSLVDDYYWFDEGSHTLEGRRTKRRFRLGDRVRVEVARVDLQRRMLDLRLAGSTPKEEDDGTQAPSYGRFPKREKGRGDGPPDPRPRRGKRRK